MVAMAAGGSSFAKTKRIQGFTAVLTHAACEWLLIFLLLIDTLLSYVLTKFASYCELQVPCILCSRLEHVKGGKNPEFYQNLLCSNHRSEISSLISCHIHDNIADGHGMCDDCLLSFTTKSKTNPKTHRLLLGKLGLVLSGCGFQSSLLSRDLFTGSNGPRPCTCCSKFWKSGQNAQKFLQLKSTGRGVFKPDISLPHVPRQSRLNQQDNLKIRDKLSESAASRCLGKRSSDPLSYVGYTELNLTSDSESEFPFSDDDGAISVIHDDFEAHNDPVAQNIPVIPHKKLQNDSNPAKPNNSSPSALPLLLDPCVEPNISNHHDLKLLASDAVNDCGLGEINWQKINQKPCSDLPELISLDEISSSPNVVNISNGQSEESNINSCLSQNSLPAALSELMALDDNNSFVGASQENSVDVDRASDIGLESIEGDSKITARTEASVETGLIVNDSALVSHRHDNSGNMSELPVIGKEREVPSAVIEQPKPQEVDRIKEELKPSQSQHSSPRVSIMSSINPINHFHYTEMQADASSSNGRQVLQKTFSVDSGLESLDESNVSEIEGESSVDRLRRQLDYSKKCLSSLQKELEEERNASAIAANEAMAMITRLQEEKAALRMEALQYLRMMEEQAEYDVDALEKANDLLAEKEKEIQDLEAELEFYRSNVTDEPIVENLYGGENSDLKREKIAVQNGFVPHIQKNVRNSSNPKITELSKGSVEIVIDKTSLEFEEEKLYISESLKSLEIKLKQISSTEISSDQLDGSPQKLEDHKSDRNGSFDGEGPQLDGRTEGTDMSIQKNYNTSNGNLNDQEGSVASDSDDCSLSKENNHFKAVGPKNSMYKTEVDLVALENEISDLHDRLEALEADHDLLEHMLNSFRNGKDGLQFIQEIAHQLHELRKIVLNFRW